MELRTYKTMSEGQQIELMAQLSEWRGVAESGCKDALESMRKCEDFNNGDQWDSALKADLEDQGKHVATIPLIRPQVNQLVGNVVSNPKDIHVTNTHGGAKSIADLKTVELKHAMESNDGLNLMAHWFHRGVITGRGYLCWMMDYSQDPIHGDLRIRLLPEMDCRWDPTAKSYDFNGTCGGGDAAGFFFFDEWVSQEWAEKRWKEATDRFSLTGGSMGTFGRVYDKVTQFLYDVIGKGGERFSSRSTITEADYSATRYRLQHCWWMEYVDCWYWYDDRRSETEPVIVWRKQDIRRAKRATERSPEVFGMIRSTVRVMHHTLSIGDQFLEDWVDEFDMAKANLSAYPVVPYYPSHTWGRTAGVVEDMIGPQESLNWFRSYVINHLKLLPNSGWIIGQDIDGYSEVLKAQTGQAAQVIDRSKAGGYIEKVMPTPFPAGMDVISDKAKLEIREVSNVRTEAPEQDTAEMSGRAILAKQANAHTGVAPSLANFDWSMKIFGKVGVDIITCSQVYSDDEIKSMVEESRLLDDEMLHEARSLVCMTLELPFPEEPPLPNPELVQQTSSQSRQALEGMYASERQAYDVLMAQIDAQAKPLAIQALIDASHNPIAGKYTCTVSLSPYSVSARLSQMASLLETNELLVKGGYLPLPERDIIEASDLPHKQRLLQERGCA